MRKLTGTAALAMSIIASVSTAQVANADRATLSPVQGPSDSAVLKGTCSALALGSSPIGDTCKMAAGMQGVASSYQSPVSGIQDTIARTGDMVSSGVDATEAAARLAGSSATSAGFNVVGETLHITTKFTQAAASAGTEHYVDALHSASNGVLSAVLEPVCDGNGSLCADVIDKGAGAIAKAAVDHAPDSLTSAYYNTFEKQSDVVVRPPQIDLVDAKRREDQLLSGIDGSPAADDSSGAQSGAGNVIRIDDETSFPTPAVAVTQSYVQTADEGSDVQATPTVGDALATGTQQMAQSLTDANPWNSPIAQAANAANAKLAAARRAGTKAGHCDECARGVSR